MWVVESQIYGALFIGPDEKEAREYYKRAIVERKGETIVLREDVRA